MDWRILHFKENFIFAPEWFLAPEGQKPEEAP